CRRDPRGEKRPGEPAPAERVLREIEAPAGYEAVAGKAKVPEPVYCASGFRFTQTLVLMSPSSRTIRSFNAVTRFQVGSIMGTLGSWNSYTGNRCPWSRLVRESSRCASSQFRFPPPCAARI